MRAMKHFAGAAALALLSTSCLTSDGMLFDQSNARARPFAEGAYEACQYEERDAEPDCKSMQMNRDSSGLYAMSIEGEEDITYARFRRVQRGAYAAQLWGATDQNPFYFLATVKGEERILSMIACEDLPASFRDKFSARGELTVEEGGTTCVAKTPGAVAAAARAWLATDAWRTGSRIVYRPKS